MQDVIERRRGPRNCKDYNILF